MTAELMRSVVGGTVAQATYGPLDREDLQVYAAASGDLNPLHLDPAFARRAGFDDVIVHGMFGMALLGRLLTEAFPEWRLQRFRTRFRQVIPVGAAIVCAARLAESPGPAVNLELSAATEAGAVLVEGGATLAPRESR